MQHQPLRLLAIDLSAKGFGHVLLDARLGLLDWGFCSLPATDDTAFVERVSSRIARGEPTALVLENFAPIKGRDTAVRRRDLAIALAAERKIGLCQVSQKVVQAVLGPGTKADIARVLARRFPELRHRMPRERTPWSAEDERMHIFDALALGVVVMGPVETRVSQHSAEGGGAPLALDELKVLREKRIRCVSDLAVSGNYTLKELHDSHTNLRFNSAFPPPEAVAEGVERIRLGGAGSVHLLLGRTQSRVRRPVARPAPRYPPYQTCHRRFQLSARSGALARVLRAKAQELADADGFDLTEAFIDAT